MTILTIVMMNGRKPLLTARSAKCPFSWPRKIYKKRLRSKLTGWSHIGTNNFLSTGKFRKRSKTPTTNWPGKWLTTASSNKLLLKQKLMLTWIDRLWKFKSTLICRLVTACICQLINSKIVDVKTVTKKKLWKYVVVECWCSFCFLKTNSLVSM